MELLSAVLTPLLLPLRALFLFYSGLTGSFGAAILLLALSAALLLHPLTRWGRKKENAIAAKAAQVRADLQALDKTLRGEARFNATEAIYRRRRFHPAHNILSGMSFIVQLPFLLAVLVMFNDRELLSGHGFFLLQDLSRPDGLLWGANLLPLAVLAMSAAEAIYRYAGNTPMRNQYLVIALALCALIYPLPSALVLYWLVSNLIALLPALLPPARPRRS